MKFKEFKEGVISKLQKKIVIALETKKQSIAKHMFSEETELDEVYKPVFLGGTSAKGGVIFTGVNGLKKIQDISKKNPNREYTISADNYTQFKKHWVRNGKFAVQTVANIEYDMTKNSVPGIPKKDVKDTIFNLSYTIKESRETELEEGMEAFKAAAEVLKQFGGKMPKGPADLEKFDSEIEKASKKYKVSVDEIIKVITK